MYPPKPDVLRTNQLLPRTRHSLRSASHAQRKKREGREGLVRLQAQEQFFELAHSVLGVFDGVPDGLGVGEDLIVVSTLESLHARATISRVSD